MSGKGDKIKFSELKDSIEKSCRVSNQKGAFSLALISAYSKSIGFAAMFDRLVETVYNTSTGYKNRYIYHENCRI
jgi:hypothetical protein